MPTEGPTPFLILPDRALLGADQVVSPTNLTGRYVGPSAPGSANEGDLIPFLEGTPASDVDLDFRILRSGGLYAVAEWAWKRSTDANTEWRGHDDRRRFTYPHDPFGTQRQGSGLCALFSRAYNRLLLFRYNSNNFEVAYRDVGATDPTVWTSTTFTPTRTSTGDIAKLVGYELPDGALRLHVRHGTSSAGDFDTYGSTDGGLTWARIARDVIDDWTTIGTQTTFAVHADISGDWVRLLFVDGTGKIETLVSSDRGASWTRLTETPSTGIVQTNGDTDDAYGTIAMVGVDDAAGTFLLAFRRSTTSADIEVYTASRDEDWTLDTTLTLTADGTNTQRIAMGRDSTHVWLIFARDDGAANAYWQGRRIRRDQVRTSTYWSNLGTFPGFSGSQKYQTANLRLVEAGDRMVLLSGIVDRDATGTLQNHTVLQYLQGWTRRSIRTTFGSKLFDDFWSTAYGPPAGASASASTPWTETLSGGGTRDWTTHRLQARTPASADLAYWELSDGGAPTDRWATGTLHAFLCRVPNGGLSNADRCGARIVASVSAGVTTDTSIRLDSSGNIVVYDNVAASTLYTGSSGTLPTLFHEFRWTQTQEGSNRLGQLAWNRVGDVQAWVSSGALTLTVGSGGLTTSQLARFGNLAAGSAGTTSEWRDYAMRGDGHMQQHGFINPDTLRGRTPDPERAYVNNGVYARWGGGGAFESDTHEGDLLYQHGTEALFAPSPQMQIRLSPTSGDRSLVFDAGARDGGVGRFIHDALALWGTNFRRVRVEYNTANSWPGATIETITADVYTGLTVQSVDGEVVTVFGDLPWVDGELAGWYLVRDTSGTEHTSRIRDNAGAQVVLEDWDAALKGFTAGQTVAVYADRLVGVLAARRQYRYLRLLVPNVSGASFAHDQFRIGAIVPGVTFSFPVPLDWAHGDAEEGNVSLETLRGGMRVSFREGPQRRRIEARVTGDANQARETLRYLIGAVADYADRPMVLVLQQDTAAQRQKYAMYCRYVGPTTWEDQAWYQDLDGTWRTAGDQAVAWDQEV